MSTTDTVVQSDDHPSARVSRPLEITFAVVALAFTATYLVLSTQIELRQAAAPGQIDARFWPFLLGTTGVAVSVALLAFALVRPPLTRDEIERIQPGGVFRVVVAAVLTFGYVAVWSLSAVVAFGYLIEIFPIATALYMIVLMLIFGQRRWWGLIIYPLALTGFIYVLFGMILRVPL